MKIFISWSGERSKSLAKAVYEWLPDVLYFAKPWLSSAEIEAGQRWSPAIAAELQESNFGVICLTPDNLMAPWILFEAGAIAKAVDTSRVVPLLFDVDFQDISGPLSQFQAKKISQEHIFDIVKSMNTASGNLVEPDRLQKLFDKFWTDLEGSIAKIPAPAATAKTKRDQGEVLEELVVTVRGLDNRLEELSSVMEDLVDSQFEDVEQDSPVKVEITQELRNAMARLSPRERDILRLRHGLDDGKPRRLREVGLLFGVSAARISQIEAKAKRRLFEFGIKEFPPKPRTEET